MRISIIGIAYNIMKKTIPIIIAIVIVVAGGTFYCGMKYQESKLPKGLAGRNFQNIGGLNGSTGQRNSNFSNGEIISKDDKSITIKLRDGGSKIIFLSDSTKITKQADGSSDDFEVGKSIMVGGKQNSDGSITADTIQLNPQIPSGQ